MQLSEEEKQKRLQALRDLLSEEQEANTSEAKDEEDDKGDDAEDKDDGDDKNESTYQEHLSAMFSGTDLSEESKQKLTVLFEAAVNYEADKQVAVIKGQLDEEKNAAIDAAKVELKEEADAYLSYVVEEWTTKNEVALKNQIKLDLMENFIGGLRGLFLEHNFNIPEEQTNMIDDLMGKVSGLEEDVKALSKKNVVVSEELEATKRQLAFKEISEGLTELDVEKLKGLVESKQFDTTEDFTKGVTLIKESYFKKDTSSVEEVQDTIISEEVEQISPSIKQYADMISRSKK